jgi:transcriptional regulator with XRE-family HTH domain
MSTQTVAAGSIPVFDLSDRLRKAREVTGLDQKAFADEVGISRGTVANYERGKVTPREIVLRAWALRTGVPLEWLKTGKAPHHEGEGLHQLPRLDSNQRPSDRMSTQVIAFPTTRTAVAA